MLSLYLLKQLGVSNKFYHKLALTGEDEMQVAKGSALKDQNMQEFVDAGSLQNYTASIN